MSGLSNIVFQSNGYVSANLHQTIFLTKKYDGLSFLLKPKSERPHEYYFN